VLQLQLETGNWKRLTPKWYFDQVKQASALGAVAPTCSSSSATADAAAGNRLTAAHALPQRHPLGVFGEPAPVG
jgi:hypothetical protein